MRKWVCVLLLYLFLGGVAHAVQDPDFPFIYSQGEATVEVAPDIATVSFQVEQFDEDSAKALEAVRNRSAELVAFFEERGIKDEDVVAYEFNKRAVRQRRDNRDLNILGYEVSRKFSVELHNLEGYEPFMKKLLSMENVTGTRTKFDRSDRDKVEEDLVVKACQDARKQASLMANGFGSRLGPVHAISQKGFGSMEAQFGLPCSFARSESFGVAQRELLFVPATISFSKNITAIFKLENQ